MLDSLLVLWLLDLSSNHGPTELCCDLGLSPATFFKWRARYGGMDTSMMPRMKEPEEESRRLYF